MARRLGRTGRNRNRPAAPSIEIPESASSKSIVALTSAPHLDVAQPSIVAPKPGPSPAPAPKLEIVVPRTPGCFETDAELGMRPKLYDAPQKRREFMIYRPAGWSAAVRAPLIVFCHGCRQTPEEFAKGSRITDLADQLGCLLLLPRQTRLANPWRCWNWFAPELAAGGGEAEIVAAQIRYARLRFRADPARVAAVGISAGAALAATLGICHPRQVRAVVTHSGVACGAASSAIAAGDVMMRGPNADVEAVAALARLKAGSALPVPLLAIHGEGDAVIAPRNSIALVRQFLRFNGHLAVDADAVEPPLADHTVTTSTPEGREVTVREWRMEGRLTVRHVSIAGLGHAWSGGDDSVAFNDRHAPDALQLVAEFLNEVFPQHEITER